MEVLSGKVYGIDNGCLLVKVPYTNWERYEHRRYEDVQVGLEDGRTITPRQRKMAYALLNYIADYTGDELEWIKKTTKHDFIRNHLQGLKKELFSLSNCDETTAREYISHLIEVILEYEIPVREPLVNLSDDIYKYMWLCATRKVCAVCGQKADLHHVDRVGMGRDRTQINHLGMKCMTLCRKHHQELHSIGDNAFCDRYHVEPIPIDEKIAKANNLRGASK